MEERYECLINILSTTMIGNRFADTFGNSTLGLQWFLSHKRDLQPALNFQGTSAASFYSVLGKIISVSWQNSQAVICVLSENIRTFITGRQFVNGLAAFTASLIRLYNDRKAARRRVHSYDSAFTSTGTFTVYYCRYRESCVLPIPSSILLCVSNFLSSFYPILPYRSKTTDSEFLIPQQNFLFFHSIFPDRCYNIFRN